MKQDQLFKDLLRTFFADFLGLFFPEIARTVDLTRIVALETEVFTDIPDGARRIADLVMGVRLKQRGKRMVLIHVEVQATRDAMLPARVWMYNALLRIRTGLRTASIAVILYPGSKGITLERYSERYFYRNLVGLEYWQVGLRDLQAAAYLDATPDLASALMALMQPGAMGKAALKIALLRRVMRSTLDEARVFLLVNAIETYLVLTPTEEGEMRAILQVEGDTNVEATELTWADRIMQQGREQGALDGARQAALRLLRARFGPLPSSLEARLQAADAQALDGLIDRAALAPSLEEFLAGS